VNWKSSIHSTGETGLSHEKILHDLADVGGSKVEPDFLTLAQIEMFAKQFYGFTARVERKLTKDEKQAALFAKTAHQARARRDKSRTNRRDKEIKRIAKVWNLPEITRAKDVKHAHLLDKDLNWLIRPGTMRTWPVDRRRKSPRSKVLHSMKARTFASIRGRKGSRASNTRLWRWGLSMWRKPIASAAPEAAR
jgi:hypothetical protein